MIVKTNDMIEAILKHVIEFDIQTLESKCAYVILICTCVLVAMIVDLIMGVRKARQRGEATMSYGLKRTVDKAIRYYGLIVLFVLLDIIASIAISLPYFTMIGGAFIVSIEIKSWFENATIKEKKQVDAIIELLKNKDDILKAAATIIEKSKDDE